jgi:putative spermidine/putrescine transport system substrate-binding protein
VRISKVRRPTLLVVVSTLLMAMSACSPPSSNNATGSDAAKAKSAADLGGIDKLVAAAKAEGQLNVIALPPDWANYGEIIKAFTAKYGIKVNSAQPDASSQDEINAAKQLKGQGGAPDVFDLGTAVALANTAMFAPYKVQTWEDIPAALKEANGTWVNDYGGYMAIGYDAGKVPAPASVADLLKPEYKGKVALNGDPTQAGAAFSGVVMAALANGGSADDIAKGVDFFSQLKKAGNFLPVDPTPATIESGQTPVVIDWDYLNVGQGQKLVGKLDWKTVVPSNAVVGSYYVQAISADAPHPAAARLWQEFLYSDEGQNLWLKGGARPVRADAMKAAGTIDSMAFGALPAATGTPVFLTEAQTQKAKDYLAANWAKAIS